MSGIDAKSVTIKEFGEQAAKIVAEAAADRNSCEINFTVHMNQGGIRRVEVTRRQAIIPQS